MRATTPTFAITLVLLSATIAGLAPPAAAQEGAHTVSGRVLSDAGEPVVGAAVSGWTDGETYTSDETTTDDAGAYTLRLGPGKGYVNVWYDEWHANDARDILIEADVSDLDFTLKTPPPKTATITGTITDEAGNAIEGATVHAWRSCCWAYEERAVAEGSDGSGTSSASTGAAAPAPTEPKADSSDARMIAPYPYYGNEETKTDAAGQYELQTYAGPHQLSISKAGYATVNVQVDAIDGESVTASATLEKVPAADAIITGRVVDAATGLPLQGAWVSLSNVEWSRYASDETDADGRYSIRTIPGWVQVSVNYWGRQEPVPVSDDVASSTLPAIMQESYYNHVQSFGLDSGERGHDIQLQPKPKPDVVLIGYAVDPDAQTGIPKAQVSFWNQDTGDWGSATTDGTGSYRILVRPGHYQVSAWADGHLSSTAMLVIEQGEATKRFDIEMPEGQTKYAPCDYESEDDGCGGVMYAERGIATDATKSSAGAPMAAPEPTGSAGLAAEDGDSASTDGRAATYQGTGGGLPAYTPAAQSDSSGTTGGTKVPGAGLALVLAALGAIALALRRK